MLRPELQKIVMALLDASVDSREVSLDAVGEAIGSRAVSQEEIDGILEALEQADRRVTTPAGGDGEKHLRQVVLAARALTGELGRKPTATEIATRAGLTSAEVRHALALLAVMQR